MTAKHTPGPWGIRDENETFISIGAETHHSLVDTWAIDDGVSKEQMEANARLIAAAPELLDALLLAVSRQSYKPGDGPDWWEICRAAIAKATGG